MFFQYNFGGLLWALFILVLCGLPGNEFPDLSFWELLSFDKAVHAFVFGILVVLLIVGFLKQYSFPRLRYAAVRWALILSVCYGGIIEVMQSFWFQARSGNIIDFTADSIGCAAGIIVFYSIYGKAGNYIK